MLQIAIIEDELEYIETLKGYFEEYQHETTSKFQLHIFRDGKEFLKSFQGGYDIILLDIEMPESNGMEVAEVIRKNDQTVVIMFITKIAKYAIHGYSVGALDYILKPMNYYAFQSKMARAMDRAKNRKDEEFLLNAREGVQKLRYNEVYYIEVQDHTLIYHTANADFTMRGTMRKLEEEFKLRNFAKCSNHCLVNLFHVQCVKKDIVVVAGKNLEISRRMREPFLTQLAEYIGSDA